MQWSQGQRPNDNAGYRQRGSTVVAEMGPKARQRAIAKARRHTYSVRALRLTLPVVTLGIVGIYALFLQTQFKLGSGTLRPGKIEVTADDLKMKNPNYFGVTKDGGKYDVRAAEAAVDFAQSGPIRLTMIDGDLTQTNGVVTKLQAGKGLLDQKKNELELFDGVNIDATNGMKAHLKRAMIYTKENRVVSQDRVTATMPTGAVKANAMELFTKERKGTFRGDVLVTLVQSGDGAGKANIGIGRDTKQPVTVKSDRFDVDDGARQADFSGQVIATQGESVLKAAKLHLEYEGKAEVPGMAKAAAPAVKGETASEEKSQARLTKLQARSQVDIVQGADRRATADAADFDIKADTALLTGNVHVQQGKNQMRGRRMLVDRKAGRMQLTSPADASVGAGRIAATFYQGQGDGKGSAPKAKAVSETSAGGGLAQFKTDPSAPIDIEADALDVNDPQKVAVFKGRVRAQQGDFVVNASELHAFYTGQTGLLAPTGDADAAAQKAGAQIQKIEGRGDVLITSKDGQEASGKAAVFDTRSNTMLLTGGVTLKQGRNVNVGSRLRVDMTTGFANLENDPNAPAGTAVAQPVPGGTQADPKAAACPPGRTCALFFPEDAKEKGKQRVAPVVKRLTIDGWQSSTQPATGGKAP
jgi:lipopolysaccharide transport protein LptA/LPS export ABC transporter protein LptC